MAVKNDPIVVEFAYCKRDAAVRKYNTNCSILILLLDCVDKIGQRDATVAFFFVVALVLFNFVSIAEKIERVDDFFSRGRF